MSIKNDNLAFLLGKTILDAISDEMKERRETLTQTLLERYADDEVKSYSVSLPNGEKVASITITEPKPKEVINERELVAWLEDAGRDDLIRTVEIPATTERKPIAGVLDKLEATVTDEGVYVTPDGVPVDGAMLRREAPKSFTVRYANGNDSKQALLDAWRAGELAGIDPATVLPEITTENGA